jgi:hypothetical protein
MANVKTFVAALGLAGAMLMPAQATRAQEFLAAAATTVAAPLYIDCYNDPTMACRYYGGGYGAYAAVAPVGIGIGGGPYAAIGVAGPGYAASVPYFWGPLRGGDWVAVHGSTAP